MNTSKLHSLNLGAAALNTTPLDFDANARVIAASIDAARTRGIDLLCLPELCITGYGCEDAFYFPHIRAKALEALHQLLPLTKKIHLTLGLPLGIEGKIYNAVAFVADAKVLGFVCKKHLAGHGVHYEPRWFTAWPEGQVVSFEFDGTPVPCGDITIALGDERIGFEICEDAWVEDRPGIKLAEKGVTILLNPSASHFGLKKVDTRRNLVLEGSKKYSPTYIYANLLGNEAGRLIYDGDTLIASHGSLIGQGRRLSFEDFVLTDSTYTPPAWEKSANRDFEEFTRVVALGLFDYLRKSRAHGFVLSLSGGADSASLAVLVFCMVHLGCAELGLGRFKEKLSYIPALKNASSPRAIVKKLLCCVYQRTENSSRTTEEAAQSVAAGVGAIYHAVSIDALIAQYLGTFTQPLGKVLSWKEDDIALQNIQARVRAPGIWLLANVRKALLLTTSNRSEAAVGYATMDGDTSGSIAPIAGIDKHFIQRWLAWMSTEGIAETGPLSFLSIVAHLPPTAELRPLESKQTDEKDLMPYAVLSAIERAVIFERKDVPQVVSQVSAHFGNQYAVTQIEAWVLKFNQLLSASQWKRERYAPSFHIDEFNIDPRSWFRFPILSGGLTQR